MAMNIQVTGKQVDVGEALGSRISQELEEGVGKYFARGAQDAEVVVSKDGYGFRVDSWVRLASGRPIRLSVLHGAGLPEAAFRWSSLVTTSAEVSPGR